MEHFKKLCIFCFLLILHRYDDAPSISMTFVDFCCTLVFNFNVLGKQSFFLRSIVPCEFLSILFLEFV
jgi:hypothetical protein